MNNKHLPPNSLQTILSQSSLTISTSPMSPMSPISSNPQKIYKTTLKQLQDVEGLDKWFDHLFQLEEYLLEGNWIYGGFGKLEVIHRSKMKKQGYVIIGVIELDCIEKKQEEGYMPTKQEMSKKQYNKLEKSNEKQVTKFPQSIAESWVNPKIPDYWRLSFSTNKITTTYGTASILSSQPLPSSSPSQLTIQIPHFSRLISLGITDRKLLHHKTGKKNQISYQSNRYFWDGEKTLEGLGLGYGVGEKVTVRVWVGEGRMEWVVGGEVRFQWGRGKGLGLRRGLGEVGEEEGRRRFSGFGMFFWRILGIVLGYSDYLYFQYLENIL